MVGYHITLKENLLSIMKEGLIPQIGKRSLMASEFINQCYFFSAMEDVDNALLNWLGDVFYESEILVLLRINLSSYNYKKEKDSWEIISSDIIKPDDIEFIKFIY